MNRLHAWICSALLLATALLLPATAQAEEAPEHFELDPEVFDTEGHSQLGVGRHEQSKQGRLASVRAQFTQGKKDGGDKPRRITLS